jgi:1-deoxy-D-xylulose-5-phosphate synthase
MSSYLDMVNSPEHVKKLKPDQLVELAAEMRNEIVTKVANCGGHLASNLGIVDLTIALHWVFETPKDKFLWDVSHQVYAHKLLTGRKDRFHTIRQTGGLSGFALRSESEHDCFGAGHAGTALSAALGMAVARDKRGSNENVVAIFGDAALTNGISFEALNNIASSTKKFIAILNDNKWSIDRNVGAVSNFLNRLLMRPTFNKLQREFERWLNKLPDQHASRVRRISSKAGEAFKLAVTSISIRPNEGQALPSTENQQDYNVDGKGGGGTSSSFFEDLGFKYLGPMDGHDIPTLIRALEFARESDSPIVLHVITTKGKGYEPAMTQPTRFHGIGPYNPEDGLAIKSKTPTPPSWQKVFGDTMLKLCKRDEKIVGITAAMPSGTGLDILARERPQQYIDVGIAEEHAVVFASAMATMGFHPVVAIYSSFMQRAFDCVMHDATLQSLPVVFCMDRAGLSPNDGPTHHGVFDISFLRPLPNLILMSPRNEDELQDMLYTATRLNQPAAIRYPRGPAEGVPVKETPSALEIGKGEVVKSWDKTEGRKIAIFALGNMNSMALKAAEALSQEGYETAVIDPRFIKPLDEQLTLFYAQNADLLVTVEDHMLQGGYGSAVLELLSNHSIQVPVIRIGWPDKFVEHATTTEELQNKYGLNVETILEKVKRHFSDAEGQSHKQFKIYGASPL